MTNDGAGLDERARPRVNWMLKATILITGMPAALCFNAVMPILADMSARLAHSSADAYLVKMMLGVIGLATLVGAPIAGMVADRYGRRGLMAWSGLVFAAAGVAPFFLTDLHLILATRVVAGLAAIGFATAGSALVGDLFDEAERPRWMGMLVAGSMVTALVAMPLSGLIGDFGWRYSFLLYLVGIPAACLAWFGTRSATASGMATAGARSAMTKLRIGELPLPLIGLALLIGFLVFTPAVYNTFQLKALGLENPSSIGLWLMVSAGVGAVASTQFGRVRKHFTSRAMFIGSFAAISGGMVLFALAPGYQIAIAGLVLVAVGIAWLSPNLLSLAAAAPPERRGRVIGLIRGAQAIAPALGITAIELIAAELGVASILLMVAGLAAVLALFMTMRKPALALFPAAAH